MPLYTLNFDLYCSNLFQFFPLHYCGNTFSKKQYTGPAGVSLLKINSRNTRTRCERCLTLTIKYSWQRGSKPSPILWRPPLYFPVDANYYPHCFFCRLVSLAECVITPHNNGYFGSTHVKLQYLSTRSTLMYVPGFPIVVAVVVLVFGVPLVERTLMQPNFTDSPPLYWASPPYHWVVPSCAIVCRGVSTSSLKIT